MTTTIVTLSQSATFNTAYNNSGENFYITVVKDDGIEERLVVKANFSISDLEKLLQDKFNLENFTIENEEGEELNSSANIKNGSRILLKNQDPRLEIDEKNRGMSSRELNPGRFHFVDFTKEILTLASDDLKPGLYLIGECPSQKCKPEYIFKGFSLDTPLGAFEMKTTCSSCKCSQCPSNLLIQKCMLVNCVYEINGKKQDGSTLPGGKKSIPGQALTFDTADGLNILEWKQLAITTELLPSTQNTSENQDTCRYICIGAVAFLCLGAVAYYFLSSKAEPKHGNNQSL